MTLQQTMHYKNMVKASHKRFQVVAVKPGKVFFKRGDLDLLTVSKWFTKVGAKVGYIGSEVMASGKVLDVVALT